MMIQASKNEPVCIGRQFVGDNPSRLEFFNKNNFLNSDNLMSKSQNDRLIKVLEWNYKLKGTEKKPPHPLSPTSLSFAINKLRIRLSSFIIWLPGKIDSYEFYPFRSRELSEIAFCH